MPQCKGHYTEVRFLIKTKVILAYIQLMKANDLLVVSFERKLLTGDDLIPVVSKKNYAKKIIKNYRVK